MATEPMTTLVRGSALPRPHRLMADDLLPHLTVGDGARSAEWRAFMTAVTELTAAAVAFGKQPTIANWQRRERASMALYWAAMALAGPRPEVGDAVDGRRGAVDGERGGGDVLVGRSDEVDVRP